MKKKYILIQIILILGVNVQAEIWPSFSIVELAIKSDRIVEAKYLTTVENKSKFLIQDIANKKAKVDTLILKDLDQYFYNLTGLENSESLILFLNKNNKEELTWSGIRILIDNKIHFPVQNINPGKYTLGSSRDSINWNELKTNITEIQKRINHIKKLKKKKDNEQLLIWIEEQDTTLTARGGLNDNKGWGSFGWDVFKWITEKNIASDTWKASILFRQIHLPHEIEWLGLTGLLSDYNGTSFKSYNEIDFLISVALSDSTSIIDKRQSLTFLTLASRKVYENNYPIPETKKLNKQRLKQKLIRDQILPLLENPNLKRFAFQVIRGLSNPMDGNLNHRIDLEVLSLIEKYYQNERPSEYKSDLAEFIVHNSEKEDWKKISQCDEKIFVDLYQVYVHTNQTELTFGINYNYGKQSIIELPIVIIEDSNSKLKVLKEITNNFKLPYHNWEGVRYITLDLKELMSGEYKVYVEGKAGEESQYAWKSEYGEFILKRK
ncbi:MAG: hypothetical protein GY705_17555 [Bacteroidetes bacterium]|nr:hypothetical protein [Bacteroidota bacterium]